MKFHANSIILPRLHSQFEGGEFMGIVMACKAYPHDHLLLDMGECPTDEDWNQSMQWARDQGSGIFLPTRREQAVMFGNRRPDQYKPRAYWSGEPHAYDPSWAWIQHFSDGYQGLNRQVNHLRARAIKRIPIGG